MWIFGIIIVIAVGYLILKFLVKPLIKIVALIALVAVAYFWLWPLLTSSH